MGKSIEELFKTKILQTGQTAQVKYDIRNSKDAPITPAIAALNLPFKAATEVRRKLSTRIGETRLEQEVTGLRIINKLSSPIIYGTAITKLTTQKTDTVTFMKDSLNPNAVSTAGLVGGTIQRIKQIGQNALSGLGIKVPTEVIPSKIAVNPDFKRGTEPNTMITLAAIRGDAKGNFVGKLLKDSVRGTPKQIGNAIVGNLVQAGKNKLRDLLFGSQAPTNPNLAKYTESSGLYSSTFRYSSTISLRNPDISARYDLSTLHKLVEEGKISPQNSAQSSVNKVSQPIPQASANIKTPFGNLNNPFAKLQNQFTTQKENVVKKLGDGRKIGQQAIASNASKIGALSKFGVKIPTVNLGGGVSIPTASPPVEQPGQVTTYSDTVDETQNDVSLRNDLSSVLMNLDAASKTLKFNIGVGIPVDRTAFSKSYSSIKNSETNPKTTLKTKLGIEASERMDFLNEKTQYTPSDPLNGTLQLADGTILDDYDFVTLKFRSLSTGTAVNFRATISGLGESTSPSWDSAKFIGSPFNYYTYSGIERSVTFSFKVYSTSPLQHVAAWQRLNFLTSLAYPQGYAGGIAVRAPFLEFTLGNMYSRRACFIESLSYDIDDNSPWHVGFTEASGLADDSKFVINGEETSLDNYKLPKIVNVSITLKLVEQRNNTEAGYLYGFDKLPRVKLAGKAVSIEQSSKNSQIAGNANNSNNLLTNTIVDNQNTQNNTALTNATSQGTTIPASQANKEAAAVAGGLSINNSDILGISHNFKLPTGTINPIAGMPPFKANLPTFAIDNNKLLGTSFSSTKFNTNSVFTGASNFNTAAASIIPTAGGLKFNSMGGLAPKPFSTSNILQTNFNAKVSGLASSKFKLNLKSGR
jgi:hypothetical protein